MLKTKTYNRKKIWVVFWIAFFSITGLMVRLGYLMIFQSEYYEEKAKELHERERDIKAPRGEILDCNGNPLAINKAVCTISVIHSQIKEPEQVIDMLVKELEITEEAARKRVEKRSSIEKVKTNVEKEVGDRIRSYKLAGVKVDEDYKRFYPYGSLASKVLGFTGSDNQGIIGLEVEYEEYLKGRDGTILTLTDAKGVEIENAKEGRIEPVSGNHLTISMDLNIQKYCEQAAINVLEEKQADSVSIIMMNPQNGEIIAMVNIPEFDLNNPFTLPSDIDLSTLKEKEKQDLLNQMWRNQCINDTYEPGSTFKVITAAAGLETGSVAITDQFSCPGFRIVEDRRIRCHKVGGHGGENFVQGIMNSCNPVFIDVGLRIGVDRFYQAFEDMELLKKTGVDLPGEARTIMHKQEDIGLVELATISFGQSFQVTPIQLLTTVSSIINGGNRITPHFGVKVSNSEGKVLKTFSYPKGNQIVSQETSDTMKYLLEQVVSEGGGKNGKIEGYRIGGKTATSQTLPRSAHKYISSFIGFVPADQPQYIAMCIINNPQGVYYGGTIAAPVIREVYDNVLPYLGLEKEEVIPEDSKEQ